MAQARKKKKEEAVPRHAAPSRKRNACKAKVKDAMESEGEPEPVMLRRACCPSTLKVMKAKPSKTLNNATRQSQRLSLGRQHSAAKVVVYKIRGRRRPSHQEVTSALENLKSNGGASVNVELLSFEISIPLMKYPEKQKKLQFKAVPGVPHGAQRKSNRKSRCPNLVGLQAKISGQANQGTAEIRIRDGGGGKCSAAMEKADAVKSKRGRNSKGPAQYALQRLPVLNQEEASSLENLKSIAGASANVEPLDVDVNTPLTNYADKHKKFSKAVQVIPHGAEWNYNRKSRRHNLVDSKVKVNQPSQNTAEIRIKDGSGGRSSVVMEADVAKSKRGRKRKRPANCSPQTRHQEAATARALENLKSNKEASTNVEILNAEIRTPLVNCANKQKQLKIKAVSGKSLGAQKKSNRKNLHHNSQAKLTDQPSQGTAEIEIKDKGGEKNGAVVEEAGVLKKKRGRKRKRPANSSSQTSSLPQEGATSSALENLKSDRGGCENLEILDVEMRTPLVNYAKKQKKLIIKAVSGKSRGAQKKSNRKNLRHNSQAKLTDQPSQGTAEIEIKDKGGEKNGAVGEEAGVVKKKRGRKRKRPANSSPQTSSLHQEGATSSALDNLKSDKGGCENLELLDVEISTPLVNHAQKLEIKAVSGNSRVAQKKSNRTNPHHNPVDSQAKLIDQPSQDTAEIVIKDKGGEKNDAVVEEVDVVKSKRGKKRSSSQCPPPRLKKVKQVHTSPWKVDDIEHEKAGLGEKASDKKTATKEDSVRRSKANPGKCMRVAEIMSANSLKEVAALSALPALTKEDQLETKPAPPEESHSAVPHPADADPVGNSNQLFSPSKQISKESRAGKKSPIQNTASAENENTHTSGSSSGRKGSPSVEADLEVSERVKRKLDFPLNPLTSHLVESDSDGSEELLDIGDSFRMPKSNGVDMDPCLELPQSPLLTMSAFKMKVMRGKMRREARRNLPEKYGVFSKLAEPLKRFPTKEQIESGNVANDILEEGYSHASPHVRYLLHKSNPVAFPLRDGDKPKEKVVEDVMAMRIQETSLLPVHEADGELPGPSPRSRSNTPKLVELNRDIRITWSDPLIKEKRIPVGFADCLQDTEEDIEESGRDVPQTQSQSLNESQ